LLTHLPPHVAASSWIVWRFLTQGTFFAAGALWCVYAERMVVTPRRAVLVAALAVIAFAAGGYLVAAPLFLPPLALIAAALLPGEGMERIGDFSYGTYLYHYPIQQTLVAFGATLWNPWVVFGTSFALVLPVAALSWFIVERPALRWNRAAILRPVTP
jgi:peptidoglycan/LPS O-acetylase OafA/YrhL